MEGHSVNMSPNNSISNSTRSRFKCAIIIIACRRVGWMLNGVRPHNASNVSVICVNSVCRIIGHFGNETQSSLLLHPHSTFAKPTRSMFLSQILLSGTARKDLRNECPHEQKLKRRWRKTQMEFDYVIARTKIESHIENVIMDSMRIVILMVAAWTSNRHNRVSGCYSRKCHP